jgi:hypothetical protein
MFRSNTEGDRQTCAELCELSEIMRRISAASGSGDLAEQRNCV